MAANKCIVCEADAPVNKAAARLDKKTDEEECNLMFFNLIEVEKFDLGEME